MQLNIKQRVKFKNRCIKDADNEKIKRAIWIKLMELYSDSDQPEQAREQLKN